MNASNPLFDEQRSAGRVQAPASAELDRYGVVFEGVSDGGPGPALSPAPERPRPDPRRSIIFVYYWVKCPAHAAGPVHVRARGRQIKPAEFRHDSTTPRAGWGRLQGFPWARRNCLSFAAPALVDLAKAAACSAGWPISRVDPEHESRCVFGGGGPRLGLGGGWRSLLASRAALNVTTLEDSTSARPPPRRREGTEEFFSPVKRVPVRPATFEFLH